MLFALCACALVLLGILIVVRAERREQVEPIASQEPIPLEIQSGLYPGPGYRLVDALGDMPPCAVVERGSTEADGLGVGRLDDHRKTIATCPRGAAQRIAWTREGESILWSRGGLERVHVDNGVVESLVGGPENPVEIRTMIAEPDGPRVFLVMRSREQARFRAHVLDLERGNTIPLGDEMRDADVEGADVVWAKDLAVVLILRLRSDVRQYWQLGLRGDSGREIGAGWRHSFTVDPSGSIVMFDAEREGLVLEHGRWHQWWKWLTKPAWAPDGLHVAGTTSGTALWICGVEVARGEKVLEVVPPIPPAEVRAPAWSSDGRFIAFWLGSASKSDQGGRMFVVDRTRREIWLAGGSIRALAWRPG